jgi:hypothetical protein
LAFCDDIIEKDDKWKNIIVDLDGREILLIVDYIEIGYVSLIFSVNESSEWQVTSDRADRQATHRHP